jgi:hypothetical protein
MALPTKTPTVPAENTIFKMNPNATATQPAGVIDLTPYRGKYRSFMFNIEVGVTFNSDAGTTVVLPAFTPLFFTDSMLEMETDAEAVMYWGE